MIIFPAIDLKDGQCVRLQKGEMDKATVFNNDPANQAKQFADQGFSWLHIVDLNGAFKGTPINIKAVESIINTVGDRMSIQLGGGIRNIQTIDNWINTGINKVILGTAALRDPELVHTACQKYPEQIIVGIDGKNGRVAVEGWAEDSEITVIQLAKKFEDAGVSAIIYTDINRDGLMQGPDITGTQELSKSTSIPIIASGGISSSQDITAIKNINGIKGMIIGRALYEEAINIEQLLAS